MARVKGEAGMLPDWLPQQRWFGAKGRTIQDIRIVADRRLVDGDPTFRHVLVSVGYVPDGGGGDVETYQLLVGGRDELPERLQHAVIGAEADNILYDAAHDAELTHVLLQMV